MTAPGYPAPSMGGKGKTHRAHALHNCLVVLFEMARRRFGIDLQELRLMTGYSRRTVYRLLDSLKRCGVEFEDRQEINERTGRPQRLIRLKALPGFRVVRDGRDLRLLEVVE